MQVIKKVLIILYTLILGFIVFFNTSVFAVDGVTQETSVYQTSEGIDTYFINCQDYFDYQLLNYRNKNGLNSFYNYFYGGGRYTTWNYFVVPAQNVPGHENSSINYARGWVIYEYAMGNKYSSLLPNSDFSYMDLERFHFPFEGVEDRSLVYQAKNIQAWNVFVIYNNSNNYEAYSSNKDYLVGVPLVCLNNPHSMIMNNISNTSGSQQITNAINSQTNTLKEETQKQTNAVVSATQSQTNQFLDTNNTGNDTMSVNDTTTDTSADLTGIYNSISSAFTDSSIQQPKSFEMTLPNGDTYSFGLSTSILSNFLNKYPALKAFYQAFFYVVFCGYVIFDFKRIINKLKEGDIDNVVGSSSPVDSVVNMSLK